MSAPQITQAEAIDRLFNRLSATYGAEWTRQWASIPISDVKTAWSHELAGYLSSRSGLKTIAHALDNLPERCPNVIQFKNLCRAAPSVDLPRLDPPKADPVIVAAVLAGLAPTQQADPHGMKAWAHRLRSRHTAGENLSLYQILSYRMALGEVVG